MMWRKMLGILLKRTKRDSHVSKRSIPSFFRIAASAKLDRFV
ncbi:hypothetical protein PB2503_03707 [Parvularcula bermudensis HTCC2503]|uniref:Uncharacterized protein n=1 Tax=Parvularcula bermudensis (strain ATCC BAA-594 / HTCC2503 / KCTC 12087) TaxID=314260 RepID=E0TDZ5_PARBH|nr:hypothetical protein PB2503_03707 [Parvularcula bermudensis HTCC2503]